MSANPLIVSRRAFVGGLVIAISLPACKPAREAGSGELQMVQTNAWLRIGTDDSITFLCDRSEMGQGVYTSLPMLIAEELGVSLARIQVEFAPPGDQFINNMIGGQITGGSTSVRDGWEKLRRAGATARHLLVSAAAAEWGIDARNCRVEDGVVVSPHLKRLKFGQLAVAASKLPVPKDVPLKSAADFTLIGLSQKRKDTPSKVDGSCIFGIDVKLPNMLHAALAQPPTLGGSVKTFNDEKARTMPGVKAVVLTSSGIAVVADSWWQARKARDKLDIQWEAGPNGALNDAKIWQTLRKGAAGEARVARNDGDAAAAIRSAARVVRAEYELPLLAHATLEPQNCTADVRDDGVDLYVPTQVQQIAQAAAAKAAGVDAEQGACAHHVPGRRFRAAARGGFHPGRGRGVEGREAAGQAAVDPRRRHDPRHVPAAGLRPGGGRVRRQGKTHRLEPAPHRAFDHRAHVPGGGREERGSVRGRGRR